MTGPERRAKKMHVRIMQSRDHGPTAKVDYRAVTGKPGRFIIDRHDAATMKQNAFGDPVLRIERDDIAVDKQQRAVDR